MIRDIAKLEPEAIVLSPGPGRPENAGLCGDIILEYYKKIPILGVCLGHQTIAQVFGSKIVRLEKILHGKVSKIYHNNETIYKGVKKPFTATRYHSLIVDKKNLPEFFEITSWTSDNVIMGIKHKNYPLEGIQFHIESILTKEGKNIMNNFLNYYC